MPNYIISALGAADASPQGVPIPGRTDMVKNEAGGYGWEIPDRDKVMRFLVLGTEGNQYYATEQQLTVEMAAATMRAIQVDGLGVAALIADVSNRGLAIKNDPALFALALCISMGTPETVAAAIASAPTVARIQTHVNHLATFLDMFNCLKNWRGHAAINAIIGGYSTEALILILRDGFSRTNLWDDKLIDLDGITEIAQTFHTNTGWDLARTEEMLIKYRQRDGWTLGQLTDLTKPWASTFERSLAFWYANWADNREPGATLPNTTVLWRGSKADETQRDYTELAIEQYYPRIVAYEKLRTEQNEQEAARLVRDYRLPWETVPDQFAKSKLVWTEVLQHMPPEAMIRSLAKLTANGTIEPMSENAKFVRDRLGNAEAIRRARLHPIRILTGNLTYAMGRGIKGSLTWAPNAWIMDALDTAFYNSFESWEPTGKSRMFLVDVSGSMTFEHNAIGGIAGLTPNVVAGAMAMMLARKEPNHLIVGFSKSIVPLDVTPSMRLRDAAAAIQMKSFGDTDAAAGIQYAINNRYKIDSFEIITDGQTWAGRVQPSQALRAYRKVVDDPNVRMSMLCTAPYTGTFCDPQDALQRDFVGFSTDTPKVLELFIRGEV